MVSRTVLVTTLVVFGISQGLEADEHIGVTVLEQRVAPSIYFDYPTVVHVETGQGYRLDWCYEWGVKCGADAAQAFCSEMGYRYASDWGPDSDIGASSPTLVMKDQAVCDQEFCDGFEFIACSR